MDVNSFTLTIDGAVRRPIVLQYDQVLALPAVDRMVRMDCMSGIRSNIAMKGVTLAHLFCLARARGSACRAVFHCADGHCESIPLIDLLRHEAFLAYSEDGEPVDDMGCPLRLAVPGKYGYKWAKWVRRVQLVADERPGHQETRGLPKAS